MSSDKRRVSFKKFFGPWKPRYESPHHTRLYRIAHGFYFFQAETHLRRRGHLNALFYSPPAKLPLHKLVWYPCSGNRMEAPSDTLSVHWDHVEPSYNYTHYGVPAISGMPFVN